MSQTLELPEDIYSALVKAAKERGTTPVAWIAERLPKSPKPPSEEEKRADEARLRAHSGAVNSGDPNSADNDRIDADLAREYGDDHQELYQPQ